MQGIALHGLGHQHAAQVLYLKRGYLTTKLNLFKAIGGER